MAVISLVGQDKSWYVPIGACRVVWVPGQDLAIPAFDAQLRNLFCHYTVRYTYICMCVCTLMLV